MASHIRLVSYFLPVRIFIFSTIFFYNIFYNILENVTDDSFLLCPSMTREKNSAHCGIVSFPQSTLCADACGALYLLHSIDQTIVITDQLVSILF